MSLSFAKRATLCLIFLTLSAITAFSLANYLAGDIVKAEGSIDLSGTKSVFVESIEEASQIAGFKVAAPTAEFTDPAVAKFTIDVSLLGPPDGRLTPRPVGQSWDFTDGAQIRLVQAPGLQSPGLGMRTEIAGTMGDRVAFHAEGSMPARVAFYWAKEGIGYTLFGTLNGSVTEETLMSVAGSLAIR